MSVTPGTSAAQPAAARLDFETLFAHLPSPYMIVDRDLRYVDVNAAYCQVTERRREDLLGRRLFEMFPNPYEGGRRLRESLERVLASGRPDTIPLIPYPIERSAARGGGLEMRYWSATHVPLLDATGRTQFVLQNTVDVTDLQNLKQMAYGPSGEPPSGVRDVLMRAQEAEAQTESLRDLFMQAPGFMAVLSGPDLRFTLVNTAFQRLIGPRPVIDRTVIEAIPEVQGQGFETLLRQVMETGEPYIGASLSAVLRRTADGPLEERFVDFVYQPILGAGGKPEAVFVEGSDVTDRVQAERQQKLLLDELNHRVKNTLAIVQAIADQTLRTARSPAAFKDAFEARLLALAATHDILTAAGWSRASLIDILRLEFRPFPRDRYALHGEPLELPPTHAVTLGLVFHELATNAAKYGALSSRNGRILVTWNVADGQLELEWRESGGPVVEVPARRGFGTRMIERSVAGQLGGEAELRFDPDGLVCRVRAPFPAAEAR